MPLMDHPVNTKLHRPWLTFDLGAEMQVLSWAINRPGLVKAKQIVWREVRDEDLSLDMDVLGWLQGELAKQGFENDVAFLTSRNVARFAECTATVGTTTAHCVVTLGLSNAERVGQRLARQGAGWGTINIAMRLNSGLTQAGLIETSSIATQARTAAVIDLALPLSGGIATGTGTDCIAIAAPEGVNTFTGLHTEIGEAVGKAVYTATTHAGREWKTEMGLR